MDSGWAVVLGAVIALSGSALFPWWREARAARSRRIETAQQRRADAIVELLARNSGVAMSGALKDAPRVQSAYEARQRAMIRLILEVTEDERPHMSRLLKHSVPIVTNKERETTPGQMASALQDVILSWAAGDLPASEMPGKYSSLTQKAEPATE